MSWFTARHVRCDACAALGPAGELYHEAEAEALKAGWRRGNVGSLFTGHCCPACEPPEKILGHPASWFDPEGQ